MIPVCKKIFCFCGEVIGNIGNLFDDSQSTEGGLAEDMSEGL